MSHVTTVEMSLTDADLPSLEKAAQELGLELKLGQKTYRWYGVWLADYSAADAAFNRGVPTSAYGKCDHALSVKGDAKAYEVGVWRDPEGNLKLVCDFYAGGYGLCKHIGPKGELLFQAVAKHKAVAAATAAGWKVQEGMELLEDGRIKITATKPQLTAGQGWSKGSF